jgi:CRP-like cAMP-binding protein
MFMKGLSAVVSLQNHLLGSLPAIVMQRLAASLDTCFLPFGKVLCESGTPVNHVYFPIDALVSLTYVTEEGKPAEISQVGNEGVVGVSRFLGGGMSHTADIVQIAGSSYRISAPVVMAEFARRSEYMVLVLRYIQALMTQMAQTAVCNKHHGLDQRFCRLLLQILDRRSCNELKLTQELIANMLGVRREGVTEAAGKLQKMGVIEYSRGHIRLLSRERLELMSCECYLVVKRETDRLLAVDHHKHCPVLAAGVGVLPSWSAGLRKA